MKTSLFALYRNATVIAGILTALAASVPAKAQVFTAVASACVMDESSLSRYETSGGRIRLKGSSTGEIVTRCNVTNPIDAGFNPFFNTLELVFRDPDARASASHVSAILWRVSNSTGGITQIGGTLDSNVVGSAVATQNAQTRSIAIPAAFNFYDYAYYVEVRISRTNANLAPDFSLVRLYQKLF